MSNIPATAPWLSLVTQSDLDLFAFENGDISPSHFIIDFAADSDVDLAMLTDCLELLRRAPCVARVAEPAAFITYSRTQDRLRPLEHEARSALAPKSPAMPDSVGLIDTFSWVKVDDVREKLLLIQRACGFGHTSQPGRALPPMNQSRCQLIS